MPLVHTPLGCDNAQRAVYNRGNMHQLECEPRAQHTWYHHWAAIPLYMRIVAGLLLGAIAGMLLGPRAAHLALPSQILLRLLGAVAPPLILIAVIRAVMSANIGGRVAGRIAYLLILNTVVAILIGLFVANLVQPGSHGQVQTPTTQATSSESHGADPVQQFFDQVPDSLVKPLVDNNVIGVIIIALAFGVALRDVRNKPISTAQELVDLAFNAIVTVLEWVINLVPIGVFCIVAKIVGTQGFAPFVALGWFVVAVLMGLILQGCYYLIRIRLLTWVRPLHLLNGMKDALVMAFSTDSSTATMPVTFACLRDKVGLREESASLGALVGSNFNNDGTALYEAMSALFVSQLVGMHLGLWQQILVILTSVVASVGAAGIPEAGIVTMTLVFTAVKLPPSYIPLLLTVDWFLDRSRTVINVMGDINVSCLLDGRIPKSESKPGL